MLEPLIPELQPHQLPNFRHIGRSAQFYQSHPAFRISAALSVVVVAALLLLFLGWLVQREYRVSSTILGVYLNADAYLFLDRVGWLTYVLALTQLVYRLVEPVGILFHPLRRTQRFNRLLTRRSDYVMSTQFNRWLDQRVPFFRSYENRWLWVLACLIMGGIVTPLGLHFFVHFLPIPTNLRSFIEWGTLRIEVPNDIWTLTPLQLMLIGLVTTTILLAVYLLYYVRRVSPRAIITEFKAITIDENYTSYINTVATTSRRLLYEELRRIAELLQRNQIENVHFVPEDANALIMTSGIETELFTTLQSVVTVEVANTNSTIDLGRIYTFLTRSLATILINGGVQRHDNGAVEIFVEMRYRNRAAAAVKVTIEPSTSTDLVDDDIISQKIREVALRLLVDLGQVPGTGRSWQVLSHFMDGLTASSQRNWWIAISQYHRALEMEADTGAQSLGVVYYHLGAAYINQQLWDEGKRMLLQAERYGPPMAETQYMLALHALNLYWGELHKSAPAFDEICHRCWQAIRMKSDFAAAYQLLGMAYYRRGRIIERDGNQLGEAKADYQTALQHFWAALLTYDHRLDTLRRRPAHRITTVDVAALMRQRMATAHQIGDALRGLGRRLEAAQFYADMEVVEPTNLRNVADTLKNYTLAKWHQKVYDTFVKHQMRRPEVRWDSEIAIHVGWALMAAANRDRPDYAELVVEAFQYLDYALYTRPRTVRSWSQTNWESAVKSAIGHLAYQADGPNQVFSTEPSSKSGNSAYLNNYHQVQMALEYRQLILAKPQEETKTEKTRTDETKANYRTQLKKIIIDECFKVFHDCVDKIIDLESNRVSDNRYFGVDQYYRVAEVAEETENLWQEIKKHYIDSDSEFQRLGYLEDRPWPVVQFSLANRVRLDFYLIVSLLAARALADARRFEPLCLLAQTVKEQMERHRRRWQEAFKFTPTYNNRSHFTFSVLVFRYQYASILAWYAYGLFMRDGDLISEQISKQVRKGGNYKHLPATRAESIERAKEAVSEAHRLLPVHPLVMYMRARLFAYDRLYNEAIIELQRLIDVIAPYDPKMDVGVVSAENVQTQSTTSDERRRLYHLERIIGRQQFVNIIQPARALELMATYAELLGDLPQAAAYLNDAVRRSPYHDKDFYLFERLASQFTQLERYSNSRAIAEAMKIPRESLVQTIAPMGVFRLAPEILELQAITRQGQHEQARQLSRRIARDFALTITEADSLDNQNWKPHLEKIDKITEPNVYQEVASRLEELFAVKISTEKTFLANLLELIKHAREQAQGIDKDERKGIFSEVFASIDTTQITNLNRIASRLLLVQNKKVIQALLQANPISDEYGLAKLMHTAMHVGQEARSLLIYLGDLFNAMAYNRVMLNQMQSIHPLIDSLCAVYIFMYLYQTCDYMETKRGVLSRKLAQSIDTYAWVVYKQQIQTANPAISQAKGDLNVLQHTLHLLLFAQRYDANRAIIHFHLACVYLDLAHLTIVEYPTSSKLKFDAFKHLELAQQAIGSARQNDRSGRLGHRIDQLFQRYRELEVRWKSPFNGSMQLQS
jgi:tetratricopeptide (TPR) repeat protein